MEQEQQAPQIRSTPYTAPMHQYGASIIMLTNPESELYKLELTLRGMRLDKEGNPIGEGDYLLNEKGISSILGLVQSVVCQNTVFSNVKDTEVQAVRDFLADTLARDLMVNRVSYGIKDASARSKIFFSALAYSVFTMSRGREGDEKRFLSKSVQEITSTVRSGEKSKGIFSSLNPWSKGG